MYILGINAFHGDSSACLLKDGDVVCAIEEERFNRIKHWAGFPSESIKYCLNDQNLTIQDIDNITISRSYKANFFKKFIFGLKHLSEPKILFDRLSNLNKITSIKERIANIYQVDPSTIKAKIYFIEHHRSHIASSFFASPFKNSAILSIDGFGDFTSTMTALGNENKFKVLNQLNYPHSLGVFYTAVTQFLGFMNYGDEYKVMGLSSYGKPIYFDLFNKIIFKTSNGLFKLNKHYFKHFKSGIDMQWLDTTPVVSTLYTDKWFQLFGLSRNKNQSIEQQHRDIAASAQKVVEDIVFHMLNHLHQNINCNNLCITGGVGQNSVLNGKILNNTKFNNLYVPSAAHDAGTSIGSSLYLYNYILGKKRKKSINTASFGYKSSHDEILEVLIKNKIKYELLNDENLFNEVTDMLIEGAVVGWFQGRAEFGPRALGNRSILVDPRRNDVKDLLNKKIKRRESFRPFAPSILKEKVFDYFNVNAEVPFMEMVLKINPEKTHEIPAVTHVDGTGRLQSVDHISSPRYHKLISRFFDKTGVPILLNTSFNENEPIVNKPEDALNCFLRTKMDVLVLENFIIKRDK